MLCSGSYHHSKNHGKQYKMATTVPLKTVYKARLKNIEKEMKENI